MNQVNTSSLVKGLSFAGQPLHLFRYDSKTAFLRKEVGEILDSSNPIQSLRQSKILEAGIDSETISTIVRGGLNNLLSPVGNHASI